MTQPVRFYEIGITLCKTQYRPVDSQYCPTEWELAEKEKNHTNDKLMVD